MKKLLALSLLLSQFIFSQTPAVVQQDLMNFEPGELIVKLKDDVDAGVSYQPNGKAVSDFNIGELLGVEEKIASSKVMFHQNSIESSISNQKRMAAIYAAKAAANPNNGYQPEPPKTMKNVFVLTTTSEQENILMLVEQLKDNPNVDYVEPNYIYGIDDFEVGDIITAEEASKTSTSSSTIEVNDPLYSSQTNITSTNIDDVWEQYTTGDGSQVIAILDTGGDYTHPDLEANTWINEAELNGVEGYDDDGNGYVDDIRGWDFINLDNAPLDDNMHGTHVAGIAGAVGNNGIGIAGAAWDVKLMHIKVFQSTGQGTSTTIADGVEYASNNGATVLNMSFGSYAESATLKLALEMAYSSSILVAAAGNNGIPIGRAPFYPAAYNYILGVEDRPRPLAGYTNYDQDGPIYTRYQNLLNYELAAPGTGIMSTVPNGGYATLTGTSMSTPLVAGGLALYNEIKPEDSKELLFGNIINSSQYAGLDSATGMPGFIDLLAVIEAMPEPRLYLLEPTSRDTINSQNGNGFWEPGETIEILPLVKNYWGPTDDVRVGVEFAAFEDQTKATIIQNEIQIGSITAYAALQDLQESLKIKISEGVANNVDIKFNIRVWSGPNQEYISEPVEFILSVTNAIIFTDYITEDMTLTNDRIWIFQNSMVVTNGATLTIEPGTTVRISENSRIIIDSDSYLYANGTSSSPITIESDDSGYWRGVMYEDPITNTENSFPNYTNFNIPNYNSIEDVIEANPSYWGNVVFNYTVFKEWGTSSSWYGTYFVGPAIYNNCQFREFYFGWAYLWGGNAYFNKSNFDEGVFVTKMIKNNFKSTGSSYGAFINNVNVTNLDYWGTVGDITSGYDGLFTIDDRYNHSNFYDPMVTVGLNIFDIFNMDYWSDDQGPLQMEPTYQDNMGSSIQGVGTFNFPNKIWFGSESEDVLRTKFWDYSTSEFYNGLINYSTKASGPSEAAHGIVWKVEVNGYNAQDEYSIIEPLGLGTHEFKVYFNRTMDTSVDPQIYYGVRIPYTQNLVDETGAWSEDGKSYSVNHNFKIGAADGINKIRVQGARDLDNFDIPIEDMRFNFLLQSAGSASSGFLAQGGLGKIDLEWVAPSVDELDDVLGYNMYRYEVDADGVESDPVKLNDSLIIEDSDESTTGVYYTDFDVVEGQTYFYKYNILRTSFETTDYSSVVSTAPLTSTLGDSNGDFAVDVLDLVHDVDYILGNNPEPFIFVAGDVNADNTINVLDIVGTVDIILNGDGGDSSSGSLDINFYPSAAIGYADFSWEGNDLYVESMHNVGGLQLAFDANFEYVLHDLPGIERLDYTQDGSKVLMLYSFNNTSIASTKTKLLTRLDSSKDIDINLAVAGTTTGAKLTPRFKDSELEAIESPFQSSNLEFLSMYPNPSSGEVTMKYYLPEQMDGVVAKVYDMLGRLVHIELLENKEGASESQMQLNTLQKGNYIVLISADKDGGTKHIANKMLIIK